MKRLLRYRVSPDGKRIVYRWDLIRWTTAALKLTICRGYTDQGDLVYSETELDRERAKLKQGWNSFWH